MPRQWWPLIFAEFQKEEETGQPPPYPEAVLIMDVVGSSLTFCKMINCSCFQLFTISENGAVLFFLVEYCIRLNKSNPKDKSPAPIKKFPHRFICSPRKFRFFKQPMNLVDFCAIIPFLLDLVIGGLQVSKSPVLKNHPFFLHTTQCKIEFTYQSLKPPNLKVVLEWQK